MDRVSAPRSEGIGLRIPPRNPAHAHPQWYELDLDDQFEDPDVEPNDPLPTERHRTVPGFPA
jgi:hypothetical protein